MCLDLRTNPLLFFFNLQYGPRYNWTASDQSFMLGSYFWGYLVTTLPAGVLSETYGGRAVIGWSMAASAVLTALIPISAAFSYWAVFVLRFLTGVAGVNKLLLKFK